MKLKMALASAAVLLAACASAPEATGPVLEIEYASGLTGAREPVGWIYARGFADGSAARCVYLRGDGTWTLSGETEPGYFGDELAAGEVADGSAGGLRAAIGFPEDGLRGAAHVYTAGGIRARYRGQAIRSAAEPGAAVGG